MIKGIKALNVINILTKLPEFKHKKVSEGALERGGRYKNMNQKYSKM
jgi:hypothetical protein